MLTVTIEWDGGKTTRQLDAKSTVIGRSRSADIRIDHPKVSGRHARIQIADDGTAELVDAGSRNGLLVNDAKVDRVAVTDGLAVTIGPARFLFLTGGGQARAESLQRLQLPDPGASGISPPPAPGSGLGTTPRVREADAGALAPLSEQRQSAEGAAAPPMSLELAPPRAPSPIAPKLAPPSRRARLRAHDRRFTVRSLVSAAAASGSIALSLGIHGFIALVLTVCVYRHYIATPPSPLTVTLAPPKSIFIPPADVREGDGKGVPDGADAPKVSKRPATPDLTEQNAEPELNLDSVAMSDSTPAADASSRAASSPRPAISLSKRGAFKKFVKVELVPDDGSWEKGQKPAPGLPVDKKVGGKPNDAVEIKPGDDPADLVRGNLENGQHGGWKTVAMMEAGEIAVVTGEYDTVQRVLDKLKLRYTTIDPRKFGGAKLSSVKVLIINCPGELDGSGILKLRSYVDKGGWVVSTDWALSPIKEAFPGYLRNVTLSPETWVGIEAAEGANGDPLLTDVFNFKGDATKWYLEERSYLFKVDPKAQDKVKVLVESAEMKKKWGTGCVAATFGYGKGRVLHIVSHLQQVSTDPKAHYSMYQFLANWMIQAAAAAPAPEPKK
ncbi:MAG: FHA domain-containing protein [Planctomycetota bacterium]